VLPPGAVPLPMFPMKGILTRFIEVKPNGRGEEFSTPLYENVVTGIDGPERWADRRRQRDSLGDPIAYDLVSLGMRNSQTERTRTEREHLQNQFLNVGRGVHVESIVGLLE
jgi:hypothetical protein